KRDEGEEEKKEGKKRVPAPASSDVVGDGKEREICRRERKRVLPGKRSGAMDGDAVCAVGAVEVCWRCMRWPVMIEPVIGEATPSPALWCIDDEG
ncbi:hypothetical protein U1Q18_001919, partial [Sarracenia purpurea var. burkii]